MIKPKTRPLLAVPEIFFRIWTLTFHMTGTVYESVSLNPGNTMECALKHEDFAGGLSVMRGIVLGHNKANMCTSSAIMKELVCLSSKWNFLKASNPAGKEGYGDQSGRNGLAMVWLPLEDSSGQMAGRCRTLLLTL